MPGFELSKFFQADVERRLQHENENLAEASRPQKSKRHHFARLDAVAAERDVARKQLKASDVRIAVKFRAAMAIETDAQVRSKMTDMIAEYERVVANHDDMIELLRGREAEVAALAKDLKEAEKRLAALLKARTSDATELEAERADKAKRPQLVFAYNLLVSEYKAQDELVKQRDAKIALLKQQLTERHTADAGVEAVDADADVDMDAEETDGAERLVAERDQRREDLLEVWEALHGRAAAASQALLAGVPASQQAVAAGVEGRTKRRKVSGEQRKVGGEQRKVGGEKRKRELGDVGLHSGGRRPGAKVVRVEEPEEPLRTGQAFGFRADGDGYPGRRRNTTVWYWQTTGL